MVARDGDGPLRLSWALRAFAQPDIPATSPQELVTPQEQSLLLDKIAALKRASSTGTTSSAASSAASLDWTGLKAVITGGGIQGHQLTDRKAALLELLHLVRDFLGEDAAHDDIEAAAACVFAVVADSSYEPQYCDSLDAAKRGLHDLAQSVVDRLRSAYGPVKIASAQKAVDVALRIRIWYQAQRQQGKPPGAASLPLLRDEFGANIDVPFEYDGEDGELPHGVWMCVANGGEGEDLASAHTPIDELYSDDDVNGLDELRGDGPATVYDSNWLLKTCGAIFSASNGVGLGVRDLQAAITDALLSAESDAETEERLFELVGMDHIELIGEILQHKEDILQNALDDSAGGAMHADGRHGRAGGAVGGARAAGAGASKLRAPAFGCQVTVATESEKLIEKQMRRDRKQQQKRAGGGAVDPDDGSGAMGGVTFDAALMRAQRQADLEAAAAAPLFTSSERTVKREKYPHVYDTLAESAVASAMVGGTKLLLPAGIERKTTSQCEEVRIPASKVLPPRAGERRVAVSEMGPVAQAAFAGMKALNRVQSIVFESAYTSNENLLVCAPTGAGKTNVAMLSIVREIERHIEKGVVKLNEFKIVYVAPMKALAAEMVRHFGQRLASLGLSVRELTGDMQLTKAEIMSTQMIVTTPEKWDVVTRKSTGDVALTLLVGLLIIDEVHLLADERGPVIETIVARTLRQVEASQKMVRIVGLSATLPNYIDVAGFLRVNPFTGLFFFDSNFRPVPLSQTYIGVKGTNRMQISSDMNEVCYDKVLHYVREGHQVMVFVHARNETVRTANALREMAMRRGHLSSFRSATEGEGFALAEKAISKCRNSAIRELFPDGFGIHHAGVLRQDRNLIERVFSEGHVRVLVCTATLAWGVNLPAHAVVIKGTQLYDSKRGSFVDIGMLDVMQIFGRAGRPQFDTHGEGVIITTHDKLSHYLSLMTHQAPIESQFVDRLADNLNAEISLGTVSNVDEAVQWLSYTYLFVRMCRNPNPMIYGVNATERSEDPSLGKRRRELITAAARALDTAKMVRFDERTGYIAPTDLGRVASGFYIRHSSVEVFNEQFVSGMTEADIFAMVSQSHEFENIVVRDDEIAELDELLESACHMQVKGGVENAHGKINILLQGYISNAQMEGFSLISDSAYIAQNASRIMRALFEIAIRRSWPSMSSKLLMLCKAMDRRMWGWEHPLRQMSTLSPEIISKLEQRHLTIDKIRDLDAREVGQLITHQRMGETVRKCAMQFPSLSLSATIQPITRTVLRVQLTIVAEFTWSERVHGTSDPWWIWVEDPDNEHIYHHEYLLVTRKSSLEPQTLTFTIPIFEPLPTQYIVRAVSDRWLGAETSIPISFHHLILPDRHSPHTELLDLDPLPVSALNNAAYEALYPYGHFNPVQTQVFHTLYHTDKNVLLGAPTGSGKTLVAELAILRAFSQRGCKAVYIAPLKALVRERMEDWKERFERRLGKGVVELTGDVAPDMRAIERADLIVTTPEKWDGISRSWQNRKYVQAVSVIVIDEIHLLGDDRGPVLEVIVSRTNYISAHTDKRVRIVGLSTACANAGDLGDWLGITGAGLYNFKPSVRPVPLEVHISGFPGKHYCPRMATMNKPAYQAIKTHSPDKPALIFVSSRRQTRLTALDLIAMCAAESAPRQFLKMPEEQLDSILSGIRDGNLKLALSFGIGMHHAGLHERDRRTVEELFVNQKIQVLIATSTLAWGVNFPAHLVVIKGTEYFDGKQKRYVDFPITDVLQMMGRAGRPQYDQSGKAVVFVHDVKKHFYRKFLYEPFPVESSLPAVLADHLNAEVVAGTITSRQGAVDYLTWTYFYRRLVMNPTYYGMEDATPQSVTLCLSRMVDDALFVLERDGCLEIGRDGVSVTAKPLGRIASFYYLRHKSVGIFRHSISGISTVEGALKALCDASEFDELPVRHNEDELNLQMSKRLPWRIDESRVDSGNIKASLLMQAHMARAALPVTDYNADTKSALEQSARVVNAMVDVCAEEGVLAAALADMRLAQALVQGRWPEDNPLLTLPNIDAASLGSFVSKENRAITSLVDLCRLARTNKHAVSEMAKKSLSHTQADEIINVLQTLPIVTMAPTTRSIVAADSDEEAAVRVDLAFERAARSSGKAVSPRYPRPLDESWWLVLSDDTTGELIALRRVAPGGGKQTATTLAFSPSSLAAKFPGRREFVLTLRAVSAVYVGLDAETTVNVRIETRASDH
eukprot:Opistho-2@4958